MASFVTGQRLTADLLNTILTNYTVGKPIVRLVQQSAQSISDSTHTALTFGTSSTVIDTHGFHSESSNTSRVTPTVAGWYLVSGGYTTTGGTDYSSIQASIRLNGNNLATDNREGPNATSATRDVIVGPVLVEVNGSTDYIEIAGFQDNVANTARNTVVSGSSSSSLQVVFDRPSV